jgi:hypothetical protein
MPALPIAHQALSDMTPDQLGLAVGGLNTARAQYDNLSGSCATLAGLVCMEAKKRLKHGEYLPWLKKHLGKSRVMASQYTVVAKQFMKCKPRFTFEQMTLALMDGAQSMSGQGLDLTHPMVSAVAEWTAGRTFYQLREEFGSKARNGGAQTKKTDTSEPTKPDGWSDAQWERYLALAPEAQQAVDLWSPLLRGLMLEGLKEKSWAHLPDKGDVSRETLEGLVLDLQNQLRSAKRK